MNNHDSIFSQLCRKIALSCNGKSLTVGDLSSLLAERGSALISFVLSAPFLILWISPPGLPLFVGLFVIANGFRIAARKGVWIPRFLQQKKIPSKLLRRSFLAIAKWTKALEHVLKPRGKFFHRHPIFQSVNGWVLALNGFFLAIPYLPGTNITPALAIALLSLAILEKDGLLVWVSYALSLFNIALFVLLPIFGVELFLSYR